MKAGGAALCLDANTGVHWILYIRSGYLSLQIVREGGVEGIRGDLQLGTTTMTAQSVLHYSTCYTAAPTHNRKCLLFSRPKYPGWSHRPGLLLSAPAVQRYTGWLGPPPAHRAGLPGLGLGGYIRLFWKRICNIIPRKARVWKGYAPRAWGVHGTRALWIRRIRQCRREGTVGRGGLATLSTLQFPLVDQQELGLFRRRQRRRPRELTYTQVPPT